MVTDLRPLFTLLYDCTHLAIFWPKQLRHSIRFCRLLYARVFPKRYRQLSRFTGTPLFRSRLESSTVSLDRRRGTR